MSKTATLTDPVPVRFFEEDAESIKDLSKLTGVSKAALFRLTVSVGLPVMRKILNGGGGDGFENEEGVAEGGEFSREKERD